MDIQVFQDFVDQNASVRSEFLFKHYDATLRDDLQYALALIAFTADMVLFRRDSFPGPLVISADLLDALTDMRGLHPHILMNLLSPPDRRNLATLETMETYYRDEVPRLKLGSFLGRNESAMLKRHDFGLQDLVRDDPSAGIPAIGRVAKLNRLRARTVSQSHLGAGLPRVSIIGFPKSVLGLGEDARCLFSSLCEIGMAPELIDVSPSGLEPHEDGEIFRCFEAMKPTGEILIFCLPAIEMMRALITMKPSIDRKRQYIIEYWPWETTILPDQWRQAYDEVDEVWASSSFLATVYRSATSKTVRTMSLYVHVTHREAQPSPFSASDGIFRFITVFDFNSRVARKNPEGAIEAFRRAFDRDDRKVELVIKTIHAEHHSIDFERLQRSVDGDQRITIFNKAIARHQIDALIASCDANISLHRAEGFGRPLVEAMMLKTTVIATQWSGPADYLTESTGYPVRSVLRDVAVHEYPFAAGQWAEPDIDHAAELMLQATTDEPKRKEKIAAAKQFAQDNFAIIPVSKVLQETISKIYPIRKSHEFLERSSM